MMSWIEFTCGECGNKYTEQTGDVDERVCDECLNHEDEYWLCLFGRLGYIDAPEELIDVDPSEQIITRCEHKECKEHNNG
jgi:hypothetical protein|tara:strand:+ start:39 stop:278 length:240 start_codon:yes stop_codon:yes gene_type:complete